MTSVPHIDIKTAAQRTVLNIPADVGFVDVLAAYLKQRAGDSDKDTGLALSEMLVLMPNRRSCRNLQDAFLRLSGGAITVLPQIKPLGDVDAETLILQSFGDGEHPQLDIPPAIAPLRRQVLLARAIVRLHEQVMPSHQVLRFDQATILANALARFLDEVQTEDISFDTLDTLVPEEFAEHWQITLKFLNILTEHWPNILAEYNVIDPALRRTRLLHAQAQYWQENPPETPVIAAGSIASIPAARDMLRVVAGLPQGQIILPGLDAHLDEDTWQTISDDHPQYFLKKLCDTLEVERKDVAALCPQRTDIEALWSEVMRPAESTAKWRNLDSNLVADETLEQLNRIECKTDQEEARVISLILRRVLEDEGKTAAVVTADRNLAYRITRMMERWGIILNDSAGGSLHLSQKGSWALNTLKMVTSGFRPREILTALRHPLSRLGQTTLTPILNTLDHHIFRGFIHEYGLAAYATRIEHADKELRSGLPHKDTTLTCLKALEGCSQDIHALAEGLHPFTSYVRVHIKMLEDIAQTADIDGATRIWRGDDGEALATFFDSLFEVGEDFPNVSLTQYEVILTQLMSQATVRPKFGAHPRLSILGQLEARMTTADCVILAGMNEGTWPPSTAADPWLSRPMRNDFGLPAREQTIGISAHDFVNLASANEVYITRALRSSGAPTTQARWLYRLDTVLSAIGKSLPVRESTLLKSWAERLDMPDAFEAMPRPAPTPPAEVRPRKLSATGIERLMRDPYEVYAKYILNLRALDPIDPPPDMAARGQLIHEILEKFAKNHPTELPANLYDVLLDYGRESFDSLNLPDDIEKFWWPRYTRLARSFATHETEWRSEGWRPVGLESRGELQFSEVPFTATAIADRIDSQKGHALAIIDYKTGTPPTQKDVDLGLAPQLWVEALIATENGFNDINAMPIGHLGYWVTSGGHPPFKVQQISLKTAEETLKQTREGIVRVVGHFQNPSTPFLSQPNPDLAPKYSDYRHLARLQEWLYSGLSDTPNQGGIAA